MRSPIAILFAALLALLIYAGNVAWWLDSAIVPQESFTDATADALVLESSRDAMGMLIAERLINEFPLLIVLESNLARLFSDLLALPALGVVVNSVSTDIHDGLVTGSQDAIVVDLLAFRGDILEPIDAVAPRLAELVPDEWFDSVEVLEEGALPDVSFYARWAGRGKFVLAVLAAVLAGSLLWFVRPRAIGFTLVGAGFVLAGFATAVVVPGGKAVALSQIHSHSVEIILSDVYDQFTAHLKASALVLALIGIAFVALGVAMWAGEDLKRTTAL